MPIETTTAITDPATEYTGTAVPRQQVVTETTDEQRGLPAGVWIGVACVAILLSAAIVYGLIARHAAENHLAETTNASAIQTVSITHPSVTGTASEIALPGNTQAFNDTPIYSRTNGYQIGRAHV